MKSDDDDKYNMRLPAKLKADFLAAAKANDREGAQLVREFMRSYVKANPVETKERER
jgi:hypothetical protein